MNYDTEFLKEKKMRKRFFSFVKVLLGTVLIMVSVLVAVQTASAAEGTKDLKTSLLDDKAVISEKKLTNNEWSTFLKLAKYKGLTLRYPAGTAAKKGDTVNIRYIGTIDGESFEGGTGTYDLVLGSNTFIAGFEKQLIGHKQGDEVDVVCTFPADYGNEKLNGKKAHFLTTINYVQNMSPTEAFLYVVNKSKVKSYPKDLHTAMLNTIRKVFTRTAEKYGITYSEVLNAYGYEEDVVTREDTKAWLVSKAILKLEGITRKDKFYKETRNSIISSNGYNNLQEAIKAGTPEAYIEYQTDIAIAMELIKGLSVGGEKTNADLKDSEITANAVTKTSSTKPQSFTLSVKQKGGGKLSFKSDSEYVKVTSAGKVTIARNFSGRASITIKAAATDTYKAATKSVVITVKPAAVTVGSAKNVSGQKAALSWKKAPGAGGYQIQYSTSKNFKSGVKSVTVKSASTLKGNLTKLTKGRTYYIRIRSFKKDKAGNLFSAWASFKAVKVTK